MNRLSLAPVTINDAAPLELVDAAAAAGFGSIGLRVLGAPGAKPITPIIGETALIAALERRLAERGVKVFSATGVWLLPDMRIEDTLPALELAKRFGAERMVTVGNDPDEARMTDNLARLGEAAAGFGIGLALELMPYTCIKTIGQAHRMVQDTRLPNIGLLIDALHLARAGGTPAEVARIEPRLIAYLQLCDAPRERAAGVDPRVESLTSRLQPGDGELPLFALMDALPRDVVIDVETPVAAEAGLPAPERARRAAQSTSRFLEAWRLSRAVTT
jgi:sugar phosphate isomerase/epimerase